MSAQNARLLRNRGAYGAETRRVLEALDRPARVPDLVAELGMTTEVVWDNVKSLHGRGWLTRVARGVYQISDEGRAALNPERPKAAKPIRTGVPRPPEGEGWTPERLQWLEKHYSRLGHRRCGELLGLDPKTVHAKATKLGLRFGEVDGFTLIVDAAELLEHDYAVLYGRAKRAGVLTYPGTVMGNARKRKAMVPDWWLDQIADERQLPSPDDVALAELRQELGLSKTHAARAAGQDAYLRTPRQGGQARLYVSWKTAERLRTQFRGKKPPAPVVGPGGVRAAIEAAGTEGMTERELYEALPCSRAAVRLYVRRLLRDGELERCRLGDTLDPFVYRLVQHVGHPKPARRTVVIPGRPRKTPLPQAAD